MPVYAERGRAGGYRLVRGYRTSLTALDAAEARALIAFGAAGPAGDLGLGQALMSSHHINATLGQPNVLRAVIGGALFLTVCGLLAFGIGLLIRHSAGAITTVVALLFVVSILVNFLPQSWQVHVDKWIPALAGGQIWTTVSTAGQSPPLFSPWAGFTVFIAYSAAALAAGLLLFRRRDA